MEQLLGVERSRIHVVHHGANRMRPQRPMARENVVLNVGAIQKRKNIARLVDAFERTPVRLEAGAWPDRRVTEPAKILARIESSPRRADIQALGYVSPDELADWYARARIFAFPSLDEGFGMPVLEAMAPGVPVVAANRAALPEVCGDAALLVDPEDVDAIHAALEQLMRDEALAAAFARRGLARAGQFSWEKAAEQTWNVYQGVLG